MVLATQSNVRPGSGAMFDRIAARYDLLNRVISLGMDKAWRRRLVNALQVSGPARVLDVATGTADVAIAIARTHEQAHVTGLDPSAGMLAQGQIKIDKLRLKNRVTLVEGDALSLPFAARHFDASCISFGIRNVADRPHALREMARVTRVGGRVCVLELGEPTHGMLAPLARLHVHYIVPLLGAWLASAREYNYLQNSIAAFPAPAQFMEMMRDAGLRDITHHRFVFGAANLFTGVV